MLRCPESHLEPEASLLRAGERQTRQAEMLEAFWAESGEDCLALNHSGGPHPGGISY